MVHVGMSQEHRVHALRGTRERRVFVQVRALLHTVIDQHPFAAGLHQMPASRHLMGRA